MTIKPDVAIAARLSSAFQLMNVSFAHIEGRLVPSGGLDEAQNVLDWNLEPVRIHWLLDAKQALRVVLPVRIGITCNDKPHASIGIWIRCEYHLKPEQEMPSADDTDHFIGITSFMHAWPYARAEVQSLTAKLSIPPLTLPVILSGNVPEKVSVVRTPATPPVAPTKQRARAKVGKKRAR